MKNYFAKLFDFINKNEDESIEKGAKEWEKQLPTLWLLGKTGAGKSSLIQALTENSDIEIGNGFMPCTKTATMYEYPPEKPLLRFLDTRGLSEAGYDPAEDIEICRQGSHALIVVMKADDVEQSDLVNALKKIKKSGDFSHLLIVHTNILAFDEPERDRAIRYNQDQIEQIWKREIESVAVDFSPENGAPAGIEELKEALVDILPFLNEIIAKKAYASDEEQRFNLLRKEILWYSGSAGASDLLPGVGIVTVPGIQGKMLHALAKHYDVEWEKRTFAEFSGALGTGFAFKYGSQFLIREAAKFIPGYGQTVGAGAAGVISAASTYALGRVACKYLYHKSRGEEVSSKEMRKLYKQTFSKGKEIARNETDQQ
jgi:uncharacterized protein (DUF697 family)/GTP-binding protein EngB required for normal cell division